MQMELGFRILWPIFRIPKPKIRDFVGKTFLIPVSWFRYPDSLTSCESRGPVPESFDDFSRRKSNIQTNPEE